MNTELLGLPVPGDVRIGVRWDEEAQQNEDDVRFDREGDAQTYSGAPDSVPTTPEPLRPNVQAVFRRPVLRAATQVEHERYPSQDAAYYKGYQNGYDEGWRARDGEA